MAVKVNKEICLGCGACGGVCPTGAIQLGDDCKAECNPDVCVDCGACIDTCPVEAISHE